MPRDIVLIVTDQERWFRPGELSGVDLPARRRLMDEGVTFERHHTASSLCTSSRSVLYTGHHMAVTRMFDNVTFPFVADLDRRMPTMGTRFRDLGYHTAYKGKWHLSDDTEETDHRDHLEPYGFSSWNPDGDLVGGPREGFEHDGEIAAAAISWLRSSGLRHRDADEPFLLAVNLVNPHDVMYFDSDEGDDHVQGEPDLLMGATRAPRVDHYATKYPAAGVPDSWSHPVDDPDRPQAHREYVDVMANTLGAVPSELPRWERFRDYYLNCLAEADGHIGAILAELDDLGLADDTSVVFTADHGELQGAHGMRGKAASYDEHLHVPLIVRTPGGREGARVEDLSSSVDVLPTLFGLAGAGDSTPAHGLPGIDLSGHVLDDRTSGRARRESVVFASSPVVYLDAEFVAKLREMRAAGHTNQEIVASGVLPDFAKRAFQRTIVTDRYKLTRYFAPNEHHEPVDVDELRLRNDVELFDTAEDPFEMHNLAVDGRDHDDVVGTLSGRMTEQFRAETGRPDDGRYLPDIPGMSWAAPEPVGI